MSEPEAKFGYTRAVLSHFAAIEEHGLLGAESVEKAIEVNRSYAELRAAIIAEHEAGKAKEKKE